MLVRGRAPAETRFTPVGIPDVRATAAVALGGDFFTDFAVVGRMHIGEEIPQAAGHVTQAGDLPSWWHRPADLAGSRA